MQVQNSQKLIKFEIRDYQVAPSQPVLNQVKEGLIREAKQFQKLFIKFNESQRGDNQLKQQYILSQWWLNCWKIYVSYEQVIEDKPPSSFFGGRKPSEINSDLVSKPSNLFEYYPKDHYLNTDLIEGLQEHDYLLINDEIWNFLSSKYSGLQIERTKGRKLELYLKKINVVIVSNNYLKAIDDRKRNKFVAGTMQVSGYMSVKQLHKILATTLLYFKDFVLPPNDFLRIWKLKKGQTLLQFYKYIENLVNQSQTYDYRLYINADLIEDGEEIIDKQDIKDELIVLELKERNKQWTFFSELVPQEDKCKYCGVIKALTFICLCKKVSYCTEICKKKDYVYHQEKCDRAGEEDMEKMDQLVQSKDSVMGVCGLKNIGNTCYMNSGLQCLSNCSELTTYFLNKQYKKDINSDNPLGLNGQLAISYAHLLKKMWFDCDKEIAPFAFKNALGRFQTMFQGKDMHDSQELISSVLDGLHEDLNLIKQKPFIEQPDYVVKPDQEVAREFWQNNLKRNKSIITDLFQGQFKSRLDCPKCKKISIMFDPFSLVSLPIPQQTQRVISVNLLLNNPEQSIQVINIKFDKTNFSIQNLKQQIHKQIKIKGDLEVTLTSQQGIEDPNPDTEMVNDIRKKARNRIILLRQLTLEEQEIPQGNILSIEIKLTKSCGVDESYRKNITYIRRHNFDKKSSLKNIHIGLFKYYKYYFKEFLDDKLNDQKNYEKLFINANKEQQLWRILIQSQARNWYSCNFCGNKSCGNCPLKYDDMTLENFIQSVCNKDDLNIKLEIFWRKIPKQYKSFEELFYRKNEDQSIDQPETQDDLTIYDSLRSFCAEEQLSEENAWYCSNCKEFMQAKKKIEIYKASKYLIFHLKRFKEGKSMFNSKLVTQVMYPPTLDLKDFIVNHSFPNQDENKQKNVLNYSLIGVINHIGDIGCGHYTAHCFNEEQQKWIDFDDSDINQIDNIQSKNGYILFYKRIL